MNKNVYRPEIDGLRSIAVLSVVFFHSNFPLFSHGFFGVDIFFVISGYLITKILTENSFDLIDFYERRVRRIVPNFFFILTISSLLIYKLNPDIYSLKEFLKSFYYSISFLSNFFFMANDYFQQNISRPFLHTWSLSIEEQFYLTYPFFLILLSKIKYNFRLYIVLLIIFVNIVLVNSGGNLKLSYPYLEQKILFFSNSIYFNFYSPLSRVWEFLFGALAFFLIFKRINNNIKNIILILSYISLFYSMTFQSEFLFYPNIFTLIPVISTFLIISFEEKNTWTYKIISNRILVFIGLRSFSLYLWHLPVYEIFGYLGLDLKNIFIYSLYFIIIFFLSELSFRFIEKPFRNRKKVNFRKVSAFIISLTILIVFINSLSLKKDESTKDSLNKFSNLGFFNSLKQEIEFSKENLKRSTFELDALKKNYMSKDSTKILVVGDSFSEDLVLALNKVNIKNEFEFRHYTYGLSELIIYKKNEIELFNSEQYKNADLIIFSFKYYANNLTSHQIYQRINFAKKINLYVGQDNKKSIFTNNSPIFDTKTNPLLHIISTRKNIKEEEITGEFYKLIPNKFLNFNSSLLNYFKNNNILFIDLFRIFCNDFDKSCSYLNDNSNIIFRDFGHLTNDGKIFLGENIDLTDYLKISVK
tara:strand:+ start:1457 stop:3385 length:1929 start_codon:yes stop_codon:yes gene_type:complete